MVNIFVSYHAQAPYQQCCSCWWGLVGFVCSISLEPSSKSPVLLFARGQKLYGFLAVSVWSPGPLWSIFLFLIMLGHPTNSAARVGGFWLCLCAPNRPSKQQIACWCLSTGKSRYFSLSVITRSPMVNIFVSYYAQAPYQQCRVCCWCLVAFMFSKLLLLSLLSTQKKIKNTQISKFEDNFLVVEHF